MAKVSQFVKDSVRKRAGNSCEKCGAKIVRNKAGFSNGSLHHRKPRRLGELHTISNLVLLCNPCHGEIHRNEWLAALQGFIVWTDPEVTPVLRAGRRARAGTTPPAHPSRGWALLVPDGSLEHLSHPEGERLCLYVNTGLEAYVQAG